MLTPVFSKVPIAGQKPIGGGTGFCARGSCSPCWTGARGTLATQTAASSAKSVSKLVKGE